MSAKPDKVFHGTKEVWNFEKLALKLFKDRSELPCRAVRIRLAPGMIVKMDVAAKVLVISSYAYDNLSIIWP